MGEKIVVGPINNGLKTYREPFVIDNDSFPVLINAYQWRGRIKRKRGTSFLCRLQRFIGRTDAAGNLIVTILPVPILVGISTFVIGADIFVDPGGASPVNLITNSLGTGVLDRATGVITITGSIPLTAVFFFPTLPVLGLEDFVRLSSQFPATLAFDPHYSYLIDTAAPFLSHDVSFYKNPPTGFYPGYIEKTTWTPTWWNGQDYQQFWTVNYQGALWATNGIDVPFTGTNIGMQFKPITGVAIIAAGPPATATLTIAAHGLVQGDFIFVNEVGGITGINFQTGYVISANPQAANTVTVEFPNATLGGVYTSGGIAQYLTSRSDTTKDVIRWFDGDPTTGLATNQVFVAGDGWVNFMPPLSREIYSIADLPPAQYYLVGARIILPFKDRLLFFGPVIQSSTGSPIYLQDTVIYSQNGTPYYTASFTGDPSLATTVFHELLVPVNQTASPAAWWEDQTGFGGFITAGVDQPIITAAPNEDVLIVGFEKIQTKLVYSGNDIVPFNFFIINSELGSASTFSAITFDLGVQTQGARGYIMTGQTGAQRVDLDIPDQVFQIRKLDNGNERINSQRDFINEWVYTTYPQDGVEWKFPNQTLLYNYRDNTYGVFNETYTHHGQFQKSTGDTWATIGLTYPTWNSWNNPWNSGMTKIENPIVIAGNQQGFVLILGVGTGEEESLAIQNIVLDIVTSPFHSLNNGDYIIISGVLGSIGGSLNGQIFSVTDADQNTFRVISDPPITISGTYLGSGFITRMYVPFIQTKQFPVAWGIARKTRLGPQQYLLTKTPNAQITLLIFLSQDADNPYNADGLVLGTSVVPILAPFNDAIIFSTVVLTCPETTNMGLTPANINLNMPTANTQNQIWHRMNTSLLGDTVQLGFTLTDDQMRVQDTTGTPVAITNIVPGSLNNIDVTILTTTAQFAVNSVVEIDDVVGTVELNENFYEVVASSATELTINVNSTGFGSYISGGTVTPVAPSNQFAEIELHGMILDVSPSSLLA